jgi:hypothetical protein
MMIITVGFFLNVLWEVLHSYLYDWNKPPLVNDIYVYIPRIVFFASLFDALFIMIFLLLNALIMNDFDWIIYPDNLDYGIIALMGFLTAILIELWAIRKNKWSYTKKMPLIFGAGLTPLVQLALTSVLSIYIINNIVLPS